MLVDFQKLFSILFRLPQQSSQMISIYLNKYEFEIIIFPAASMTQQQGGKFYGPWLRILKLTN
jgi:hypothetical protein